MSVVSVPEPAFSSCPWLSWPVRHGYLLRWFLPVWEVSKQTALTQVAAQERPAMAVPEVAHDEFVLEEWAGKALSALRHVVAWVSWELALPERLVALALR